MVPGHCAIDHGMTSPLFLDGLYDTPARVKEAIAGGANVLMLGRGVAKTAAQHFRRDTSLAEEMMELFVGIPDPDG